MAISDEINEKVFNSDYDEDLDFLKQKADIGITYWQIRIDEAYDNLKKLIDDYYVCKNELCLKCGNYKEAHLGKCDGCRWCEVSK